MFETFGEIAFSSKTGAAYMALGSGDDQPRASSSPVLSAEFSKTPWSPWGSNNKMPEEIADDIRNCGVLAAALDAKARIGTGKGLQPFMLYDIVDGKEDLDWVDDTEIHDWLDRNETFEFGYDSSYDKHSYGWNAGSYLLQRDRKKIYGVKRHDVFECRLEKQNKQSRLIENLYMSADWAKAGNGYDPDKQSRIVLLEEGNELIDLEYRLANNIDSDRLEFGFINRSLRNGDHYYPTPAYRSGKAWIKIARSVPAFKQAMFKNQITLKYMVHVHPKFWEDKFGEGLWKRMEAEEKKKQVKEYYLLVDKWLSGEDNTYKSLFTSGFYDEHKGVFIPYIEVKEVDDKIKDGKWLPESGAANSEILFALMINPALMGAGNPGGKAYGDTSGGSNVRESFLVQIMIMEAERRLNASVFNVIKKFNGWSKRLEVAKTQVSGTGQISSLETRTKKPRLVFRHPTGILTTLDTGKSTKSEAA
jgi:hypothetical protein